jgi:formylmethanofuran dehydrogenase subunit E
VTGQGNVALNVIFRHKGKGTRVSVLPGMFQFCHQKQKIRKKIRERRQIRAKMMSRIMSRRRMRRIGIRMTRMK